MDFEKIEEDYRKELEQIDKDFTTGISHGQDVKLLEQTYRQKSTEARKKYYDLMTSLINEQKKNSLRKKKKSAVKEKLAVLNVQRQNFDIGFKQRTKLKWSLRYFKFKFIIRNYIKDNMPYFMLYFFTKMRIMFRHLMRRIRDLIDDTIQSIKTNLASLWDKTKELSGKLYKKLVELPPKVLAFLKKIFAKKKKDEKGKEGAPGEKKDGSAAPTEESKTPVEEPKKE